MQIRFSALIRDVRDGRSYIVTSHGRLLLSEDLQEGFNWGGVTVTNCFASPAHPLLRALLGA